MLHTFSAADPLVKSCLFKLYCLSLYACSLWNLSCHSLCSIEVSFDTSGIFHVITILGFCTSQLYCPAFSRSSTLLSRALSSPYVVKTIFCDSSVLAFTQTGFNAMFGHQFAKPYHHQNGICAEVIRHLCLHGNPSEINDLFFTIYVPHGCTTSAPLRNRMSHNVTGCPVALRGTQSQL